jgi:hypothetical protein
MREKESRIGSAVAVRLQAGCKRNPALAGKLAQVVELEREAPTVETDVRQGASLGTLADPARRAAEALGSLLEVEQMPWLSDWRRGKLPASSAARRGANSSASAATSCSVR